MPEKVRDIVLLWGRLPPVLRQRKNHSGASEWHSTLDSERVGPIVDPIDHAPREIGDPFVDFGENLTPEPHQRLKRICSIEQNPNVRGKLLSVVDKCL